MNERPESRAKAIAIINLKGGVGKTHAAWLLAGVCQERGRKVLVIDTDTQANITKSLLPSGQAAVPGVEVLFDPREQADPNTLIRPTRYSHIHLLPASAVLAAYDLSDRRVWERSDLHLSLAEGLRAIRDRYDYLVFDCPPRLSLVSFAALCASDYVIIPLEVADWGAQGIVQVTAAVNPVRERYNPRLVLLGYLVSRFKKARGYQRSYLAKLREHFGALAFDTVIPDLAGYEKSVTHGVPITLHAPASIEAGIARRFFAEVERRIHRIRPDPDQPRRQLDTAAQQELDRSVKRLGILQPITVRFVENWQRLDMHPYERADAGIGRRAETLHADRAHKQVRYTDSCFLVPPEVHWTRTA